MALTGGLSGRGSYEFESATRSVWFKKCGHFCEYRDSRRCCACKKHQPEWCWVCRRSDPTWGQQYQVKR